MSQWAKDISARSRQKIPGGSWNFFLSGIWNDFLAFLMSVNNATLRNFPMWILNDFPAFWALWCKLKWKYSWYNNCCVRSHKSDTKRNGSQTGPNNTSFVPAQSGGSIKRDVWNWCGKSLSSGLLSLQLFFADYFYCSSDFPHSQSPGYLRMRQKIIKLIYRFKTKNPENHTLLGRTSWLMLLLLLFLAL